MTTGDATADLRRPLLEWLLLKYPDTPRKRAKEWIQAGRVTVNGTIIQRPHERMLDPQESLQLLARRAALLDLGPGGWGIHPRVTVLHLDTALAIVDKGPGLLAVPSYPGELSALSILGDVLSGKLPARDRALIAKALPPSYRQMRPMPVHRLDQYTSGVFCIAMNPAARQRLIEQLKQHTMRREYVAYVEGRPTTPTGTWRNWLQLSPDEFRQFVLSAGAAKAAGEEAQEAITHYEVIREFVLAGGDQVVTKLRLRLETGRKHQIRVQAAWAGLPLLGDQTYHPRYQEHSGRQPLIEFPRQALHAEVLGLEHPDKPGQRVSWTAALPKDMSQLEDELRHRAKTERAR